MAQQNTNGKRKSTIKKVWHYLKNYRFLLILSILMAALTVAGTLYVPILVGDAIDFIIKKGQVNFAAIAKILEKGATVILFTGITQWIMNICNNHITFHVTRDIRNEAMKKIEKLPLKYIDGHSYGDVVSRVIADVDQFADGLLMGFTQFFTGVVTILGTLGFIFSIHVGIALLVVCLTPISLLVARFIATHTYSMFKLQSETRGEQTALIEEMIEGEKVVKAFGYEKRAGERFAAVNDKLQGYSLKAIFFSSITNPSTRFVNSLVYASVALSGALTAIGGGLSVGQLTCLLSYANQYTKPFNEISGVITELQNALACADRLLEFLDSEEMPADPELLPEHSETAKGQVTFDNVCFSYTKDRPLIRNFSLDVPAGCRVAIVGPTGCGKTTMINLLMRFYDPDSGSISVDGTNTQTIPRRALRRNFGMVLQETWLKTGTVLDNIRMGRPDASEEDVIAAAKAAHAHSFIEQLPNGYYTQIGEDGGSLSAGQKQLLCISRIMLTLPPMLILDEATSASDPENQMEIDKAIQNLCKGRTVIVVAHRLSALKMCDRVAVVENHTITSVGTHEEVRKENAYYRKAWEDYETARGITYQLEGGGQNESE